VIEISTDKSGKGEVALEPSTQKIEGIVLQGAVTIVQRPVKGGSPSFTANCRKLTYQQERDVLIMEGSPEIFQGGNQYQADRIVYDMKSGKLVFEGNVRVFFTKAPDSGAR
jgi:lipopolysaccharide transport protein LptA